MFEAQPRAKVNLTLEVIGRRPDGYHDLNSIFLRVGLSDRLAMALAPAKVTTDRLTVTGHPGAPIEGNLVLKALDALRDRAGVDLPALDVTLEKQIPAAAGLGGGSSDAASALRLAQECWGIGIAPAEELALAASLGSDVPFFISGYEVAFARGRGEEVESLPGIFPGLGLLLVTPAVALATGPVFARYDELRPLFEVKRDMHATDLIYAEVFLDEPTTGEMLEWASRLRDANDLWPAAASLEPTLPALRSTLEQQSGCPWLMSGSGPTLFALYASAKEAAEAGRSLARSRLPELESAVINAVDLVGPDPIWRFP